MTLPHKAYHCCATCVHFESGRMANQVYTRCRRLGYDTKSSYQFKCWTPREDIVRRMNEADKAGRSISSEKPGEGYEG